MSRIFNVLVVMLVLLVGGILLQSFFDRKSA